MMSKNSRTPYSDFSVDVDPIIPRLFFCVHRCVSVALVPPDQTASEKAEDTACACAGFQGHALFDHELANDLYA